MVPKDEQNRIRMHFVVHGSILFITLLCVVTAKLSMAWTLLQATTLTRRRCWNGPVLVAYRRQQQPVHPNQDETVSSHHRWAFGHRSHGERYWSAQSSLSSSSNDQDRIPTSFPVSNRRALLIQKIQQQQQQSQEEPAADKVTDGIKENQLYAQYYSYGEPSWSNRFGSVLTPASIPGVSTADRPFFWNNIDVGCRMTVIELSGGGLWIHSPVALDGPLFQMLQQQGWSGQPVKYIVSPNYEHVKYANQWHQAFPNAQMWACPGLRERIPQIQWAGEIPYGYRPTGFGTGTEVTERVVSSLPWEPEIQTLHIDTEANPFTGKAFFNECIFYHQPSQTLLSTDLYWNYPQRQPQRQSLIDVDPVLIPPVKSIPWSTSLWKFGMDQVYQPFYLQLMTREKDRFESITRFLVNGCWSVETLIPAHGDIVRGSPAEIQGVLRRHFNIMV